VKQLLAFHRINLAIDVGAHLGQFAQRLRQHLGYTGRIVSFEPQPDIFERLKVCAEADDAWDCHQIALGAAKRRMVLNTTENSWSSSLLTPTAQSIGIEPGISVIKQVEVSVARLDSLATQLRIKPDDRIFLKVDAQGFEKRVLEGSRGLDGHIALMQLELPFIPTYEAPQGKGAWMAHEALPILAARGWRVIEVLPGWRDKHSGELLEADFIFARAAPREPGA
jgi:FkbM family methyltransferase